MPRRRDFVAEDFFPWFGHIRIVRVERTPFRLKVTLSGTEIVRYDGLDCTGKYLEDIIPLPLLTRIHRVYAHCIERKAPVFDHAPIGSPQAIYGEVRRLLLPFGDLGVAAAIYADQFDCNQGTIHQLTREEGST